MRNQARALPNRATGRSPARRALASLVLLTGGLASASPSATASDDYTAISVMERVMAARSREALAGRATPLERMSEPENDAARPQQRTVRNPLATHAIPQAAPLMRLASLGHYAPMSLPPDPPGMTLPETGRLPGQTEAQQPLGPMLASLGRDFLMPGPATEPSLSGEPIRWLANADCLARPLRAVLAEVAANFGPLRVNSTCRSKRHNARVGGAPRSYHLTGNAVDFRISGSVKAVLAFLSGKRTVGGLKHYGFGVFHIDTGPRRTWGNKSWGKKRAGKRRRTA